MIETVSINDEDVQVERKCDECKWNGRNNPPGPRWVLKAAHYFTKTTWEDQKKKKRKEKEKENENEKIKKRRGEKGKMRCQGKANKGKDIFSSRLKLAAKLYPKWMVRFHAGRIDFSGGDQRRRRRSSIQCQDIPRLCVATIIFTFPLFSEQRAVISSNFRIGCNNSVRVQSGFSQDSVRIQSGFS